MTPELLDDLLERSAPATRSAHRSDLEAMIGDARRQVPRARRRRIALASGALALLLAGGAGVAAATDGLSWAPWVQHPVGAVAFTMANGFDCELRFSQYSGGTDAAFVGEVNRALEEWYRSTDIVGEAEALLPAQRAQVAAMDATEQDDPEADMSMLSPREREDEIAHRAWASEWLAWDLVVSDLETRALNAAGLSVPDDRLAGSERASQIQCFDANGDLYAPGAGS